jgi:hypothetical protein
MREPLLFLLLVVISAWPTYTLAGVPGGAPGLQIGLSSSQTQFINQSKGGAATLPDADGYLGHLEAHLPLGIHVLGEYGEWTVDSGLQVAAPQRYIEARAGLGKMLTYNRRWNASISLEAIGQFVRGGGASDAQAGGVATASLFHTKGPLQIRLGLGHLRIKDAQGPEFSADVRVQILHSLALRIGSRHAAVDSPLTPDRTATTQIYAGGQILF